MSKVTINNTPNDPRPEEDRNNPDEPMRYNLYELGTEGWEIANANGAPCQNLTKEVNQHYMQMMLDNGVSPDRIKVVRVS